MGESSGKNRRPGFGFTLLHGWSECFDDKGRKYYLHRRLKITQWDVPDEILQYLPPLPRGWIEMKDEFGKTYYVNMAQKLSQRARPGPRDAELLELARASRAADRPRAPDTPRSVERPHPVTPQSEGRPAVPPSPLNQGFNRRQSNAGSPARRPSVDSGPSVIATDAPPSGNPPPTPDRKPVVKPRRVQIRTDDLEEGWVVVINKKESRAYFYNARLNKVSWDVPTTDSLPEGWTARLDFQTLRRFYVNKSMSMVQWRFPSD